MFRLAMIRAVNPPKAAGAWMWRQQTHREWLMHGRLPFREAGPEWALCKLLTNVCRLAAPSGVAADSGTLVRLKDNFVRVGSEARIGPYYL